jgi:hypothetical protein
MNRLSFALAVLCLAWAAYNWHYQGSLDWAFRWRPRKEAPVQFVLTTVAQLLLAATYIWLIFPRR